ncbi:MAG: hypothetical protein U0163_15400 [Gemmatimonadaceae bacterium]
MLRCSRTRHARRAPARRHAGWTARPSLNYGNIPTRPTAAIASIGMTEAQAKEKKLDYKVGKFPFSGERPSTYPR